MHAMLTATHNLHRYIIANHWDGAVIAGPDPIGKIHWRVTRFIRSYLPWLPGDDRYVYLQAQAYWIFSNIQLYRLTGDETYRAYIKPCADAIVARQLPEGGWLHPPIRGRKGFISTVEGTWAGLGLAAAYQALGDDTHLQAALRYYDYMVEQSGFQQVGEGLAAKYYNHATMVVPNVTTMTVWLVGELYRCTHDEKYLAYAGPMLQFLEECQLPSGELPYSFDRPHFMCYQYNAFQFMDLVHYHDIVPDDRNQRIISRLAGFLATGLTERGSCRYNCFQQTPEVNYWTAALAAALHKADRLNLGHLAPWSDYAYNYLLSRQQADGKFTFSEGDYGFLADTRSYPRNLVMTLRALLYRLEETSTSKGTNSSRS